jgi:hypothetical protein
MPYPKKVLRLPSILSQEEVAQFIESARTPSQPMSRKGKALFIRLVKSVNHYD